MKKLKENTVLISFINQIKRAVSGICLKILTKAMPSLEAAAKVGVANSVACGGAVNSLMSTITRAIGIDIRKFARLLVFAFFVCIAQYTVLTGPKFKIQLVHASEPEYSESSQLSSPQADSTLERGVIKSIVIKGQQFNQVSDVRSFIDVAEGEIYDSAKINLELKKLYAKNLFSEIDAHFNRGVLTITVKENPFIHNVAFEGNKAIKDEKLNQLLETKKKRFFTNKLLKNDIDKLLYAYQLEGYHDVTISPKFEKLEQNRINLFYVIKEGRKARIANIRFIGNRAFSDKELQNTIVSKITSAFTLFSRSPLYNEDQIEMDKTLLQNKYQNAGYYDFVIQNVSSELSEDRTAFVITFVLQEGLPYRVSGLEIINEISDIPDGEFSKIRQKLTLGEVASLSKIQEVKQDINRLLWEKGYAFAQVSCSENKDQIKHNIDFVCKIDHGFKTYINQINIRGNERTADKVIRRHLFIQEGQAYSLDNIKKSQRRLGSLGYFSSINIEPKRTNVPDKADFEVEVAEQSTGALKFNVQLSNKSGLALIFELTEANIAGTGNIFEFSLKNDSIERGGKIKFVDTSLFDSSVSGGIELFYNKNINNIFGSGNDKNIKADNLENQGDPAQTSKLASDAGGLGKKAIENVSIQKAESANVVISNSKNDNVVTDAASQNVNNEEVKNENANSTDVANVDVSANIASEHVNITNVAIENSNNINAESEKKSKSRTIGQKNSTSSIMQQQSDYKKISYGFRIPITYDINYYLRHGVSYTLFLEDLKVSDRMMESSNQSDFIKPFYNTKVLKSGVATDLIYDSRDNPFLPSKGQLLHLKLQINGLGGDVSTLQSQLMGSIYMPIYKNKVIGKISAHYGDIFGLNGEKVRILDNFKLGQEKMRGFDMNGIGVVDGKNRDPGRLINLGGKTYYQASGEVMMPAPFIPEDVKLKIVFFYDIGTCYGIDVTDSPDVKPDPNDLLQSKNLRASVGAGLVWISPLGPIRFEYGYPYQKEAFDSTENVRFSFGSNTAF